MMVKRRTKKPAVCADDMMVGLEESDEARALLVLDFAEADEGVHLVEVAADLLGHPLEPVEQGIGAILHRPAVGAQLEQHGVEQGEALGVRMADRLFRQVDEAARHGEAWTRRRRAACRDRRTGRRSPPSTCHDDRRRRDAGLGQPARGIAPAVEIILGGTA